MMKKTLLAAIILAHAPAARAGAAFEEYGILGLTGGYYGSRTEAESPIGKKGLYRIGARLRTARYADLARGSKLEYSIRLSRELYHVTVKGRLGTAPPNDGQHASYRLAQGEVWLHLYGLTLGPEHPELSAAAWESSGTAPAPESLDRTWVTTFGMVYTNTDHHIQRSPYVSDPILVVIENTWQFEARETWRDRVSLALQGGGDRYNRTMPNSIQVILKDNVDYAGNPFAVSGWPNNWIGVQSWQGLGRWRLSEGFTRLNLLNNKLDGMYGIELQYSAGKRWRLRSGYYKRHRRGDSTSREALTLGAAFAW